MAISQDAKKKCGSISLVLLIAQLIFGPLVTLIALTAGAGGHPPGGVILLIFLGVGMALLAPIGVLLGALGNPTMVGKSLIGLVGNLLLSLIVFWFLMHI